MGNVRNRGFKHCGNTELSSVLVRGFREVGEIVVRIVDEHRVTVHGSDLVEPFGFITCVEGGLGQIAKLLVLVRSGACPALSGQVSTAITCGRDSRERERESRRTEIAKGG